MPLFSPQLMGRKRNNNQLFKDLAEEKNVEIHKHSYTSIIWIFKKLNFLKSNYLTNYLQSKTTFWAKLSHSITWTLIALNKFVSSLCLSSDLSYRESTVAAPISFHKASYLVIYKILFSFSWIATQILLQNLLTVSTVENSNTEQSSYPKVIFK